MPRCALETTDPAQVIAEFESRGVALATQVEYIRAVSCGSDEQIRRFFADSLLHQTLVAVGASATDGPWARTLHG